MSKAISIENYCRKRGLQNHTVKMKTSTVAAKLAREYFNLITLGAENTVEGVQEYLKKCEELKKMKNNKSISI